MALDAIAHNTPRQTLKQTHIALLCLFIATLLLPRGVLSNSAFPLSLPTFLTTNTFLHILYVVYLILGSVAVTIGWIVALCITTEQLIGGSRSERIQSILQCVGMLVLVCFAGFVFVWAGNASAVVAGYVEVLMWPLALYRLSFVVRSEVEGVSVSAVRVGKRKEKVDGDVEKGEGESREVKHYPVAGLSIP